MKAVYLSLNQGWTQYKEKFGTKEARIRIRENANRLSDVLRSTPKDFSFDPIDLGEGT
jgi:5-methylcytosine-specific restriction protein A